MIAFIAILLAGGCTEIGKPAGRKGVYIEGHSCWVAAVNRDGTNRSSEDFKRDLDGCARLHSEVK